MFNLGELKQTYIDSKNINLIMKYGPESICYIPCHMPYAMCHR